LPNWKDFCKDDTDEINNGSTMTPREARRIIWESQNIKYSHYWNHPKDYKEALRVIGEK